MGHAHTNITHSHTKTHTHKHTIMGERGEGVEIDLFEFAGGLKRAAMEATTLRERAEVVFV